MVFSKVGKVGRVTPVRAVFVVRNPTRRGLKPVAARRQTAEFIFGAVCGDAAMPAGCIRGMIVRGMVLIPLTIIPLTILVIQ